MKKIGIVTVYEPISNMGSFLQAYAMKTVLEKMGYDTYLIENVPAIKTAIGCLLKINPKREFFLRVKKTLMFFKDMKKIKRVPREKILSKQFDLIVYGSDEIWNMDNLYFRDKFFWGGGTADTPKISYAVSVGAMTYNTFAKNMDYIEELPNFKKILVRDEYTWKMLTEVTEVEHSIVCDPTLLIPVSKMSEKVKKIKSRYMLVYTYGLDNHMQEIIIEYARNNNLKIVSPCFWHLWADEVIECSALQFSSLMQDAECVFTSTFHGAIFALLNHKRCCILPQREKVKDVVWRLGEEKHLIKDFNSLKEFSEIMEIPFDEDEFEEKLLKWREQSMTQLEGVLKCLEA